MATRVAAPNRILLIQLRWLGDVVLDTALLENLATAYPDARRDFLVGRRAAPLLVGNPLIDERLVGNEANPLAMVRALRSRRYDWIIDVQSSPGTAQLTLLSGALVRVGWGLKGWSRVYTHVLPRSGRPAEYVVRERQRLLELLGVPASFAQARLYLTDDERLQGERELTAAGAPGPRVGLVVSARQSSREWRSEGFAEVTDALAASGTTPVVFEFPGDAAKVAAVRDRSRAVTVARVTDTRQFLGMLSACSALLAADTGPVHMANALGVPTVTLYGPGNPSTWNPGLPTTVALQAPGVACLGCRLAVCPIGHDCMVGITSEMVMAGLRRAMGLGDVPISR